MKKDRAIEVLVKTINAYAVEGDIVPPRAVDNSQLCKNLGISKKELRSLGIDLDNRV